MVAALALAGGGAAVTGFARKLQAIASGKIPLGSVQISFREERPMDLTATVSLGENGKGTATIRSLIAGCPDPQAGKCWDESEKELRLSRERLLFLIGELGELSWPSDAAEETPFPGSGWVTVRVRLGTDAAGIAQDPEGVSGDAKFSKVRAAFLRLAGLK